MKNLLLASIYCFVFVIDLSAQNENDVEIDSTSIYLNEVVVSDSKFELKREHSGKTIIRISEKDLELQAGKSLATLINQYSGIEINGSRGQAGQNLSYLVRGGNNRQVLILIDGVQVSDASRIANDFDWQLIHLDLIESIEIIKGAASTLYGSGAATAVISIKTKSTNKEPISLAMTSVVGTNQSKENSAYKAADFSNAFTANGSIGKFNYSGSFGQRYTNGLSAVIDSSSFESDQYDAINAQLKLGVRILNRLDFSVFGSLDKVNSEFDNSFPIENATFDSEHKHERIGLRSNYEYRNGSIHLTTSLNRNKREFESNFPNEFNSNSEVMDLFNKYNLNNKWYLVAGMNYVNHEIAVDALDVSMNQLDPYANAVFISGNGFQVNAGVRLNNHSEYGSNVVYSINPSYLISVDNADLKIMGSYATSFIAPTLNQLFGQFGANPNLQPETNRTIEVGMEIYANNILNMLLIPEKIEKCFSD